MTVRALRFQSFQEQESRMSLLEPDQATIAKPAIFIEAAHYERLYALARTALARQPEAARLLLEEIERAAIVEETGASPSVVRTGGAVAFRDDRSGRVETVRLVYPGEADIAQGKVSVLTPIGAALIGMPQGGRIVWTAADGSERSITVLSVSDD
jgi:regulator of nucleoside diphosphate kinase